MSGRRAWLLDQSPASRAQANAGRAYRLIAALLSNPLAVFGALIVLLLILSAAIARCSSTTSMRSQHACPMTLRS